nr:acyl-CoA dehydrogenase [Gammaproteobacteria bacterium]
VGLVDGSVVKDVPWGRRADAVIALDPAGGPPSVLEVTQVDDMGSNLAGEARDVLALAEAAPLGSNEPGLELMALARVAQMAGALERILELTLQYANEREQFGRPIARFQAIQHNLAVMAAEVAAAVRIADAAVDALGGERFEFEVAAAKARVGEAAGVCAESAHQVHGAMGFTHEHQLHHFTRRVWAWREEFGNEVYWRRRLGGHIAGLGADSVWDFLATRG